MEKHDFIKHGIVNFTWKEIEGTGADPRDITVTLMIRLQRFRLYVSRVVVLLPNGLTTGEHGSKEHREGKAADIAFRECDGDINVTQIFKYALIAGFRGIGIYHNQAAYSFHLDMGNIYRFWSAYKLHRKNEWTYRSLIVDPKDFTKGG